MKRLEAYLMEKGIAIPRSIFALFDLPFEEFSPEHMDLYEQKIKGKPLFHIFSDMLVDIYQRLDADKVGWEAAANFLDDTPMRVCALHALRRIDQLESMQDDDYEDMVEQLRSLARAPVTPREHKYNIRPYATGGKNHWWKVKG